MERPQLCNQAISWKLVSRLFIKGREVKNSSQTNWRVFIPVLREKLLQNSQSLRNFCIWGCKEAALSLRWPNFLCIMWKNALIIRVRMLAKYAIPYRQILRCPVKRGKGIIYDCNSNFFASKWTHPRLNLCIFSDIYESETRDAQVDGSLRLWHLI